MVQHGALEAGYPDDCDGFLMSAPVRADIKYYRGANAAPTNNTDPIGGAIYTTSELNPATPGNLFKNLSIGSSSTTVYSIHYRKAEQTAPGILTNARFYNRAGAVKNTSAGTASIASNSPLEDTTIRVTGKIGGVWDFEDIDILGTAISVGTKTWDANTVLRWEATSGQPVGIIGCSVAGELCGVIYGTSDDPTDGNSESIATYMCSAETTWALATAKNSTLSASNRLTAPGSIGSFYPATKWLGEDDSLSIPSTELEENDYIGIVCKLVIEANVPQPLRDFQLKPDVFGDAQAA